MLAHRLKGEYNIEPVLDQRFVFAGNVYTSLNRGLSLTLVDKASRCLMGFLPNVRHH